MEFNELCGWSDDDHHDGGDRFRNSKKRHELDTQTWRLGESVITTMRTPSDERLMVTLDLGG
jgi:hypothetical protein